MAILLLSKEVIALKSDLIKRLLLLLLLIPMISFGETWVCGSMDNDPNRISYTRVGDEFIWNEVSDQMKFKISLENNRYIYMQNIEPKDFFATAWIVILDKKEKKQSVANMHMSDTASWQGNCIIISD